MDKFLSYTLKQIAGDNSTVDGIEVESLPPFLRCNFFYGLPSLLRTNEQRGRERKREKEEDEPGD